MIYRCCDERRRAAVAAHPTLGGIDWLEVVDRDAPAGSPRQRTLLVRLLKPVPPGFGREQVRITGGERVRDIRVAWAAPAVPAPADASAAEAAFLAALDAPERVFVVRTDRAGDHGAYTLRLVRGTQDDSPPVDFDPRLRAIEFFFKVECPSEFDCLPTRICTPAPADEPDIDYLAKDYESFRRLALDRLRRLAPGWRERSAADLAVTLAELLAYVGDHLSYWQDAIATEAYLETARRRTSLRRHARLVDYTVHDGANARAWVQVRVSGGPVPLPDRGVWFLTRVPAAADRLAPDSHELSEALTWAPAVFEPLAAAILYEDHNELFFHTWGGERCCLPRSAVRATLRGHHPDLAGGQVLILREAKGPLTGEPADADPTRRHAVRLVAAEAFADSDPLTDPLSGEQITEIAWHAEDALPFSLCVCAIVGEGSAATLVKDVSTALGNVVLADHGQTVTDPRARDLGAVPAAALAYPPERDADPCARSLPQPLPPRYRPRLARSPLTWAGTVRRTVKSGGTRTTERVSFDPDASAAAALRWEPADVVPAIDLTATSSGGTEPWTARRDLLDSAATDRHFVVEVEDDGTAVLRFGDDAHGKRPDAGTTFVADYRVGNGAAGNVGTAAIAHLVSADARLVAVTNPLPASGGSDPETAAQVRRRAPQAFRTQERAVTPADYAEAAERHAGVQRAAASLRWTGSWHTVFVTVDRVGGRPLDTPFTTSLRDHLERYRMAGHDLRCDDPVFVPLELDLVVCVAPEHFRADVRAGLLAELGSRTLPDGRRGLFHPDNLSFGQTVYLSPIYAAARRVAGVASVEVTRLHRQGHEDARPLDDGGLALGRLEIPRLDNDPDFPEHGVLRLELRGGK